MMLVDYDDRDVLSFRAFCYFRNAQYDEALLDLREAVHKDDQGRGSIRHLLSIPPSDVAACADDEFRTKYLELMNEAVQLDDNSADSLATRAAIRIAFRQFEHGRADLNKILTLKDAGYYPHYQAALLSVHLDQPSQYESLCVKMLNDFSESGNTLIIHFTTWTCALAPDALDDYQPAIQLARETLETEPTSQQYITSLGAILLRAGRYDEAKEQLEQALAAGESEKTSTSYIRYFLAMTEHHAGNTEAAQEQLEAARSEYEAAFAIAEELAARFPDTRFDKSRLASAHNQLGMVLSALGQRESARAEYEASLSITQELAEQFPDLRGYQMQLAIAHRMLRADFKILVSARTRRRSSS